MIRLCRGYPQVCCSEAQKNLNLEEPGVFAVASFICCIYLTVGNYLVKLAQSVKRDEIHPHQSLLCSNLPRSEIFPTTVRRKTFLVSKHIPNLHLSLFKVITRDDVDRKHLFSSTHFCSLCSWPSSMQEHNIFRFLEPTSSLSTKLFPQNFGFLSSPLPNIYPWNKDTSIYVSTTMFK